MIKLITYYLLGLLLITSCKQTENKKPNIETTLKEKTVSTTNPKKIIDDISSFSIINNGPRGGRYLSSNGTVFRYTIYRVQIINDTIIPLNLTLNFPPKSTYLLPDSTIDLKVFLIPEKFTPNSIKDTLNFGVEMEKFFESGNNQTFDLNTIITPEKPLTVYIGILYEPQLMNGITRTKLFVEGLDKDAPFYPVNSVESYNLISNSLHLQYGISFDPPNYHISIPCGQIRID